MSIEDLMKMKPRELQILIATKVVQLHDVEVPSIKEQLERGSEQFKDHNVRLVKIETTIKPKRNGKERLGLGGALFTAVAGIAFGIGKGLGWW